MVLYCVLSFIAYLLACSSSFSSVTGMGVAAFTRGFTQYIVFSSLASIAGLGAASMPALWWIVVIIYIAMLFSVIMSMAEAGVDIMNTDVNSFRDLCKLELCTAFANVVYIGLVAIGVFGITGWFGG